MMTEVEKLELLRKSSDNMTEQSPSIKKQNDESIHKKPLYPCTLCKRTRLTEKGLQKHMASHERRYLCSECGKSFRELNRLRDHEKLHQEKTVQCPQCPLKFFTRRSLRKHLQVHKKRSEGMESLRNPRPKGVKRPEYANCSQCDKRVKSRNMWSHLETHGKPKYVCAQCGKAFRGHSVFLDHQKRHKGRTFQCDLCPKKYFSSSNLYTHKKHKHENIRAYAKSVDCDICGDTFQGQYRLKKHKLEQHGVRKKPVNVNED